VHARASTDDERALLVRVHWPSDSSGISGGPGKAVALTLELSVSHLSSLILRDRVRIYTAASVSKKMSVDSDISSMTG